MSPPQQPRSSTGPPRLAETLLRLSVRDRNARDGLLGDLQEEYTRLVRRGALTKRPRWAWYVLAIAGLSGRFLLARLPGSGGAGSRPPTTGNAKGRTPMIDTLLKDLRYSVRTLRKSPAFTAVVVLSLGLGIGATSTIFSALNPIVLRPLPFTDPDRLVAVQTRYLAPERGRTPSVASYLAWRDNAPAFEQLEWIDDYSYLETYPGIDGVEQNWVGYVSLGLFRFLGVEPILGRNFVEEDAPPGPGSDADVVILSYEFWQRRFGGDPNILGQTLRGGWGNKVVVGVMPPGFLLPRKQIDIWTSRHLEENDGNNRWMTAIGRLKPGVSMEGAQTQLTAIARGLDHWEVSPDNAWRASVYPLHERYSGSLASRLYLLMGAAVLVLLIACSNVASLLVGRATSRHREITTRAALGAGRLRLMRQMLTESIVLALLGGALGALMAQVGTRLFVILAPRWNVAGDIRVDGMVLGFTLGLSLLTVVLFGMVPALRASKPDLAVSLKEGARGSAGGSSPLVHKLLVGSQIALTFVLLVGAALMINSLVRLVTVDRGFNPERLVTAQVNLSWNERYVTSKVEDDSEIWVFSPEVDVFYREILERLRALPGVEAAAAATGSGGRLFNRLPGPALPPGERRPWAVYREVSSEYFAVMGIPLLKGRSFTESDTEGSPRVAVITETLARQHFPDENPIGRSLNAGRERREIVGIVADFDVRTPRTPERPGIYVPQTQHFAEYNRGAANLQAKQLVLKTSLAPTSLAADVRRIVADVDPEVYVADIETMQAWLDRFVVTERFWMRTLGIFATLALVLATVGIYGVVAYAVAQRTHEIGVRMALGAQRADVLKMVLRQGLVLSAGGLIVGVLGAVGGTRLLASWLYEIEATDPATFVTVAVVLVGIALLATYVPARGATRVDPVNAMRSE